MTNTISPDQYSSRKHHKSINTVLNKVLLNDILHQKERAGAIGMKDTRGCYNIIVYSIAILALTSFVVSEHIARALFKVLQQVDHHMKTRFGRSGQAYGNKIIPHQGSGQGNGLGPFYGF